MRIAIIQNVTKTDHRMVYTDGIARKLVQRGIKVDVIIQKSKDENQFEKPIYNVIELKGETYSLKGQLRFMYELAKYLKNEKYDVIHAKNPFSSTLAPILYRLFGRRFTLIYDIRGLWADFMEEVKGNKSLWIPLIKRIDINCMNLCDGIITMSDELAYILQKRGVNQDKIRVIMSDGADISKIRKLSPINLIEKHQLKPPILGYVGSVAMGRRSHKIIEAFKQVANEIPDARLVMIGPIYGEENIKKFIDEINLSDKVLLLGYLEKHDEVLRYCKSFDVALAYHDKNLPSFNVMVPIKLIEYLACGRPIVATDHKAHKNLLKHGFNAFLTKQDPESYAEGIISVLRNPKLSAEISSNALQSAEKYDFQIIADQTMDFYDMKSTGDL